MDKDELGEDEPNSEELKEGELGGSLGGSLGGWDRDSVSPHLTIRKKDSIRWND